MVRGQPFGLCIPLTSCKEITKFAFSEKPLGLAQRHV